MAADERRSTPMKTRILSAFIGVHRRSSAAHSDLFTASEGVLDKCVAGKRSRPRGYPGRGSDWGFTFVHFRVARSRLYCPVMVIEARLPAASQVYWMAVPSLKVA